MLKLVIGIVGPIGAGKDTAADYLVQKYGFVKFSTSDELRRELRLRGKENFTRQDIQHLANELWQHYRAEGRDILAERALQRLREAGAEYGVLLSVRLLDGLEHWRRELGEIFHLLAITATQKRRFARKHESNRSDDSDMKEWEAFKSKDDEETAGSHGGAQEVGKLIGMAEETIVNEEGVEELYHKLDTLLAKWGINAQNVSG